MFFKDNEFTDVRIRAEKARHACIPRGALWRGRGRQKVAARINTYTSSAVCGLSSTIVDHRGGKMDRRTDRTIRDLFGRAHRARYATGENVRSPDVHGRFRARPPALSLGSARPPPKRPRAAVRRFVNGQAGRFRRNSLARRSAPHRRAGRSGSFVAKPLN